MDRDSEVIQETPDLDFDDNAMDEQETADIVFSDNVVEMETPDIDFSENVAVVPMNRSHENRFDVDESEFDDMDEPDQYVEDENYNDDNDNDNDNNNGDGDDDGDAIAGDGTNTDSIPNENSESVLSRKSKGETKTKDSSADNRLVQLPTARVKHIMKADPDVTLITGECTFLVTKATELFIESLAREAFLHTAQSKKKTVQKRDVDAAIENVESLIFLEGMMNF